MGADVGCPIALLLRRQRTENSGVDDRVYASSSKSFKLEASGEKPARAAKRFSLPVRVPYDVSVETFSIVAPGETAQTAERTISPEDGSDEPKRQKRWDDRTTGGTQRQVDRKDSGSSRPAPGTVRRESAARGKGAKTMSGVPVTGTFYVYAFDGRLLAEYDVLGLLVREYIYFGGQLVAEYRNQESRLLYYASDQINSTRIVTDNTGTVVYSAAHEPYGGIQKAWISSYDPSLKFSGKERDAESELDYFGARYYDRSQFRLLSPNPTSAVSGFAPNSPAWNAYSYPGNQPWAEEYVSAGWMASATNAEAVLRPKPPKPPKPEPEKIKSSAEKRSAEDYNWRRFRENWKKAEEAAKHWMSTSDPAFFVQLVTISKGLEKETWGFITKYEYGSDPVMDAYLADYGMSTDPDNPLSYWNPCYVMYHLYYNI